MPVVAHTRRNSSINFFPGCLKSRQRPSDSTCNGSGRPIWLGMRHRHAHKLKLRHSNLPFSPLFNPLLKCSRWLAQAHTQKKVRRSPQISSKISGN
jgi:hypothetical protein